MVRNRHVYQILSQDDNVLYIALPQKSNQKWQVFQNADAGTLIGACHWHIEPGTMRLDSPTDATPTMM